MYSPLNNNDASPQTQVNSEILSIAPTTHFTRIEHQLLLQLPKLRLSDRQHGVLLAVVAKTLRWHKAMDWITASQIAQVMDYPSDLTHIRTDIKKLVTRRILTRHGKQLGLNLNLSEWMLSKAKPQCEPKSACLQTDPNPPADKHFSVYSKTKIGLERDENQPSHNKETSSKEKRVKQKTHAQKATKAPAYFQILSEHIAFAERENISVDLIDETERFLDYHRAKGSTFQCWNAAWRNWIRSSQRFYTQRSHSSKTASTQQSLIQEWLDGTLTENPLTHEGKDLSNGHCT